MEPHQLIPCGPGGLVVHIIIVSFVGLNTMLTTWLTLRARGRDKKEAEHNGKHDAADGPA